MRKNSVKLWTSWKKRTSAPISYLASHTWSRVEGWRSVKSLQISWWYRFMQFICAEQKKEQ